MEDSHSTILERLLQAAGLRRDSQLAEMLGVSPQAVSQARRKGRVPDGWILKLAGSLQLSTDWLCYGTGTPHLSDSVGQKDQMEPFGLSHQAHQADDTWLLPLPLSLPEIFADTKEDSSTDASDDFFAPISGDKTVETSGEALPCNISESPTKALDEAKSLSASKDLGIGDDLDAHSSFSLPGSVPGTPVDYRYGGHGGHGGHAKHGAHGGRPTPSAPTDSSENRAKLNATPLRGNAMPSQAKNTSSLTRSAEVTLPSPSQHEAESASQAAENLLDVTLIPLVGARLAAGAGSLETDADVQGYFAFRQDWLRRKGNPERMVLMKVFGDSMEPDIHHGDMVLVNQGHTQIFGHAIYAVGVNEEIYIKQVETSPNGLLRLRSLNPRYEPIEVNLHGDLENSVRIIGRVIWWCREA